MLLTTGPSSATRAVRALLDETMPGTPVGILPRDGIAGRRLAGRGHDKRVILVRPDGHAGYVGPADELAPFREYLARWYRPQQAAAST
jgi:hypothetical protein